MKLAHLHLQDPFENKSTLICKLDNGSIRYIFYGGTESSGIPLALSNMQCKGGLPIQKESESETKEQFKERLIKTINERSVERVVADVPTNISFEN